jgi:hypothetical protein
MRAVYDAVYNHDENHDEQRLDHARRKRVVEELAGDVILLADHFIEEEKNVQADDELNQELPHVQVFARFLLLYEREHCAEKLIVPQQPACEVHETLCFMQQVFRVSRFVPRLEQRVGTQQTSSRLHFEYDICFA